MYKHFKRTDGLWSITTISTGQTLSLSVPSDELALQICLELNSAYSLGNNEGRELGYHDGFYDGLNNRN
jgi:hypothetical protein